MEVDTDKIDDAVLALLYLTMDRDGRAWKGHDWDALDRRHEKGLIGNPKSKARSIVATLDGEARAKELFEKMFAKSE